MVFVIKTLHWDERDRKEEVVAKTHLFKAGIE
jgi:hypothetical protein